MMIEAEVKHEKDKIGMSAKKQTFWETITVNVTIAEMMLWRHFPSIYGLRLSPDCAVTAIT